MTCDELLALARECGICHVDALQTVVCDKAGLLAFSNALIERCAAVCDEQAKEYDARERWHHGMASHVCAARLRAMKVPT